MSGWVGVTQKPRVGVQRGSPAAGRGACAHAWATQSSWQEAHAEGPQAGQPGPEASGRDVPDACILLGASVGTSGTSEGPAARPPARRPPGLSPLPPGLCPGCPLLWLLLLTPYLSQDTVASGSPGTSGLQTRESSRGPAQNVCVRLPGPSGQGQAGRASGCSRLQACECQTTGPGMLPSEL